MWYPDVAVNELAGAIEMSECHLVLVSRTTLARLLNWARDVDEQQYEGSCHATRVARPRANHPSRAAVAIHIDENGLCDVLNTGGDTIDVYVVDECALNDRVYQVTGRASRWALWQLLGPDQVGSRNDDRHKVIAGRISAALESRPHLQVVGDSGSEPSDH